MKKLITFLMTAMCMTFMGAMTANAADTVNIGDTNGDGSVNSSDSSDILGYYADISVGNGAETNKNFTDVADINNDGRVDSSDASYVLAYYGYASTIPKNEKPVGIRDYLKIPEKNPETPPATTPVTTMKKPDLSTVTTDLATKPVTSTKKTTATTVVSNEGSTTQTTADSAEVPVTTTEMVNYVLAPEGLYPGAEGSIQYIVNTAELVPHDDIPLYNIKGDNINGGLAYQSNTYYLTDDTKKILNDFAKEHFTDTMTNYDRLAYTWEWLHYNVDYASSWEAYSKIDGLSFSEACFVYKSGQCIQYNGAFAEMMAYMGYDVYLLEKWQRSNFTVQHFMSEVNIGGVGYNTEVGERSYDNPATNYRWMWLFDSSKQEFFGIGQKKPTSYLTGDIK